MNDAEAELEHLRRTEASWRYLAEAGVTLGASLDTGETLREVARLSVPRIADWCAVELVHPVTLRPEQLEVAHTDPAKTAMARELRQRYPAHEQPESILMVALQTRKSVLVADIPDAMIDLAPMTEEHRRWTRALGLRSAMCVPMIHAGQPLGAITYVSSSRSFGPEDLQLAEEVARRAGLALANAESHRQAQEAIHLRDVFLTLASHELKTPLTTLQLQADALARTAHAVGSGGPALRRRAALVASSGRRLAALLDRLLQASRVAGGELMPEAQPVEIEGLCRDVVRTLGPDLERAGCELRVSAERVEGSWDPLFVEEIVSNLVNNALRFGAGRPIELRVARAGSGAEISVRDHGPGVAATDRERIFERFERGVSERNFGGLGLGLWISRNLAHAMGGTIAVADAPGGGAVFTLRLPGGATA